MTVPFYVISLLIVFIVSLVLSVKITYKVTKQDFMEQIKLDITLQQMIDIEKKIEQFLETHNITQEGDLESIAKVLNVKKGGVEKGQKEQAYLKEVKETGEKEVFFKKGLSNEEEQFVYAHELAHLLNGDAIPVTRPNNRNKAQIEQVADYTAAALLMPMDSVYNYLIQNGYTQSSPRKRTIMIRTLCKKYGVTEVIALRRVKEVFVVKQNKL